MNVEVEMWAFCEGSVIRNVEIPDKGDLLDEVFHWGQNDFQRRDCPSVSVGDIVRHPNGTRHMVMGFGFLEVPKDWTPEKYMVDHGGHKILPPMFSGCDTFEGLIAKWDEFNSEVTKEVIEMTGGNKDKKWEENPGYCVECDQLLPLNKACVCKDCHADDGTDWEQDNEKSKRFYQEVRSALKTYYMHQDEVIQMLREMPNWEVSDCDCDEEGDPFYLDDQGEGLMSKYCTACGGKIDP